MGLPENSYNLSEAEEIEMIDHECGEEYDHPAQPKETVEDYDGSGMLQAPNLPGNGAPLPEKKKEQQAGKDYKGAAFHRFGDESCPPTFETRPRHDGVLNCKESEETRIDEQCRDK